MSNMYSKEDVIDNLRQEISEKMEKIFTKYLNNKKFPVKPSEKDYVIDVSFFVTCIQSQGLLTLMDDLSKEGVYLRMWNERDKFTLHFYMKDDQDFASFKNAMDVLSRHPSPSQNLLNSVTHQKISDAYLSYYMAQRK